MSSLEVTNIIVKTVKTNDADYLLFKFPSTTTQEKMEEMGEKLRELFRYTHARLLITNLDVTIEVTTSSEHVNKLKRKDHL